MRAPKVSFVIPTKNEEATIASVIKSIHAICNEHQVELHEIVVTDDSTDKTRSIAGSAGASVIVGGGKGLGTAMLKGLKHAVEGKPDIVISIDADGQVDLKEIPVFIRALIDQEADMVLGSRFLDTAKIGYRYPFINRLGVRILSFILRRFTKLKLTDSHGGIRAMRVHVIEELEMIGSHTYVQETIIDAAEKGFKIIEIPSNWLKREQGKSRVVFSIPKYVFYTLPVLTLRAGNHIKYLFNLGVFLIMLALIHITIVMFQTRLSLDEMFDRQSFVLFLVLFSTGINLFFFGVTLELVSQIKRRLQ